MNNIFKKKLKELAEYIYFPTLIYCYETKRIIAANSKAKSIFGGNTKNVKDMFCDITKEKYSENLLDNGSELFLGMTYLIGEDKILVDEEINVIALDNIHICIVFFEYSYKHVFESCLNINTPRIFWKTKAREDFFKNGSMKGEISKELLKKSFEKREEFYHEIKMIPSKRSKEFFIHLSQIVIIDKKGESVGILGIYHRILGREETVNNYEDAIKDIVRLEREFMRKEIEERKVN